MAHFNPAVSIGYLITGHITKRQLCYYVAAELAGALLGSLLVLAVAGPGYGLGENAPGPDARAAFPVEVLAAAMLMAVILVVVYTRGLRGMSGLAIGGIVGIDILLFSSVSGASMNPARALAPALLSGSLEHMWLYLTAPFAGTAAAALLFRGRFARCRA